MKDNTKRQVPHVEVDKSPITESVLELFCGGWWRRTSHVALVIEDIACSWQNAMIESHEGQY